MRRHTSSESPKTVSMTRPRSLGRLFIAVALVSFLTPAAHFKEVHGASVTVFGPEDFVGGNGPTLVQARQFNVEDTQQVYLLRIHNGGSRSQYGLVSSAVVRLNGAQVAVTNDFSQKVVLLERPVRLQ